MHVICVFNKCMQGNRPVLSVAKLTKSLFASCWYPKPVSSDSKAKSVLDVQSVLKDSSTNQTTLLCNFEGEGCRLNLQIPVDKSQWNPAAVVQCVHLGGGFFEGLQSFGSSIVDALTSGPAGSDVPDT
eukprot:scaffold224032_cov15-Tisochrysis_lutea.AAC.1